MSDRDSRLSKRRNLFRIWTLLHRPEAQSVNIQISEEEIESYKNKLSTIDGEISKSIFNVLNKCDAGDIRTKTAIALACGRIVDLYLEDNPTQYFGYAKNDAFRVSVEHIGQGYVIPLPHLHKKENLRARKRKASLICRGIAYHKIFPDILASGRRLEVIFLRGQDGLAGFHSQERIPAITGALFKGISLQTEPQGSGFIATAIKTENYNDQIDAHTQRAKIDRSDILLFPELTINNEGRRAIKCHINKTLKTDESDLPANPMVIVAGSWHDSASNGTFENVAPIYDRWGNEVGRHVKFLPYWDKFVGSESIRPGNSILIIVSSMGTFAIAICRDFCEATDGHIYSEIDTDCILVISMGNENAMQGHIESAQHCYYRWRNSTFVIQQNDDPKRSPLGFVLRSRGRAMDLKETFTSDTWNAWTLGQRSKN